MVRAGLGYLAAADAAQLPVAMQAECLRELEQTGSVLTAARASFLSSFTAGQGYADDGDYSAVSWLMHRTGITRGAAVGHTAWARRTGTHPKALAALAAGQVTESAGRLICLWTGKLPEQHRDDADEVLLAAAAAGLGLEELAVIGKAVDLLSGPGGLASFLRRRQLGARLAGPSLPLDIGYAETIPAGIRNAVLLRDRHCQWAGACSQPAGACQVHHTKHKANGGTTSVKDCVLLCSFHHQVVIHRWGWTLVVNPDGTTTAWNKDKTKVLHSHGPPARAG
jgi:hypothetical protein